VSVFAEVVVDAATLNCLSAREPEVLDGREIHNSASLPTRVCHGTVTPNCEAMEVTT
jgi:hypothetical protein